MLEALFALSRKAVENEPLKIFMAISDLDRHRAKPLAPATVDRLARDYRSLRRAVRDLQRCAVGERQDDHPVPRYRRSHRQDQGSAAARRCRRNHAGAGRAVADLLPPGQHPGRRRRMPLWRALLTPSRRSRRDREVFDAGRAASKLLLEAAGSGRKRRAAGSAARLAGRCRQPQRFRLPCAGGAGHEPHS